MAVVLPRRTSQGISLSKGVFRGEVARLFRRGQELGVCHIS